MFEADALVKLQEIDLKLLRLASQLQKMPQQQRLKTIELASKKTNSELTGIVGRRKDAELEIEDTQEDLAHYRSMTAEVQAASESATTHRELRDYETQLTSLAKRVEKCEFMLGPARERLQKLELAERNARLMLRRLDEERAATNASLEEESAGLKEKIRALAAERDRVCEDITPEHLAAYEEARRRFKGLAVERLHGNVPSVCRVKLQPSLFHDLAHGDEITTCPYCHRMLVTSEGADAE